MIGGRTDVHEQLFADDMMAHPLAHDGSDASYHVLQSILDGYTRWADLWKVKFSEDKSKIVWFSNKRKKLSRISFHLQGFDMSV